MTSTLLAADFVINEALAKDLVKSQFGIVIHKTKLLGEGFDNIVFLFNDHLVFRFPRRHEALRLIELELRVLPAIASCLPIKIPKPKYLGQPTESYNSVFYGHELLAGTSGCQVELSLENYRRVAHDLGEFLSLLHALKPKDLALDSTKLEVLHDRTDRAQMLAWLNERYEVVEKKYNLFCYKNLITSIITRSMDYKAKQQAPVLVHGDLYHRHLLFNRHNKLAGVIDWGDSCLSDRVVDFVTVFQFFVPQARDDFFKAYGNITQEELSYARFLGLYYIITLLWFGDDRQDQYLIKSSLSALEQI
jgi:aminoglycoside phosphotransferase (APT) family kinase protein